MKSTDVSAILGGQGTTNTDYVINVNLPSWGSQTAQAPVKTSKDTQLYYAGAVLLLLVGILFAFKKK